MLKFSQFITETQNDTTKLKHLSHLEDLMFEEGSRGLKLIQSTLQTAVDWFDKGDLTNISAKFDGSPSLVVHKSANDFWVGTKSVFAKTPKLNRTEEDIETNHGHAPGLVTTLKYALEYMKSVNINGTIQGDVLFTADTKKQATIDGVPHVTFRPNTLTYAVPMDSPLGKTVQRAKFGIVFHTYYTGDTLESMKANFNFDGSSLKGSADVFLMDANIPSPEKTFFLSPKQKAVIETAIGGIQKYSKSINHISDLIAQDSILASIMQRYNNSNVRAGSYTGSDKARGLVEFLSNDFNKAIDKLKTEKAKVAKADIRDHYVKMLTKLLPDLSKAYGVFTSVVEAKELLISHLMQVDQLKTFDIDPTTQQLKVVGGEGFVAVAHGRVVKLVSRLDFSRRNFAVSANR